MIAARRNAGVPWKKSYHPRQRLYGKFDDGVYQ
jgi:hypothetical protein